MMMPSGMINNQNLDLEGVEEFPGVYVAQTAYDSEYDYFSPSPLFPNEPDQNSDNCDAIPLRK